MRRQRNRLENLEKNWYQSFNARNSFKILAGKMYDLLNDTRLLGKAKAEFNKRAEKRIYMSTLK